jgi:hypothetical protein
LAGAVVTVTAAVDVDLCAEALFASDLQPSQHPSTRLVWKVVHATVIQHGETWCAARVAQEFGEHPDCACRRMAWAREAVNEAFAVEGAS